MCGIFPPIEQFFISQWDPAGCTTDWTPFWRCLHGEAADPTGKGSVPQDCCPLPRFGQVPVASSGLLYFWPTGYINRGFPPSPPQVWYFARMTHKAQGNTCIHQFIVKDITEGTVEHAQRYIGPGPAGCRSRSFCPLEPGCAPPFPYVCSFTGLEVLSLCKSFNRV